MSPVSRCPELLQVLNGHARPAPAVLHLVDPLVAVRPLVLRDVGALDRDEAVEVQQLEQLVEPPS
eukprot:7113942-Alexandrium_andersonii.AAC.1